MLAAERRNLILERLQEEKKVVVASLSQEFSVSEETIRRDLSRLDRDGFAVKTYGGAVLPEGRGIDMPFGVRRRANIQGKKAIGRIIEGLVAEGEHIIVDPSTTAVAIVEALRKKKRLTIITSSIEVLVGLADVEGWDVISTGGVLKGNYLALLGPRALEGLASVNADKAIFSCKAIDREKGVTDSSEMLTQLKSAMLRSAARKILAVDHTKFDKVAFSQICGFGELDMVVTDVRPSDEWLDFFAEKGIRCLYGEGESRPDGQGDEVDQRHL